MYNDRTQQNGACFRMGSMMPKQSMPMHDLPMHDMPNSVNEERSMPRRRCDGSLRNSSDRPEQGCMDGCGKWGLRGKPLAMVYSPCQSWQNAYAPDVALERGTLFSELDLPFEAGKNRKGCTL